MSEEKDIENIDSQNDEEITPESEVVEDDTPTLEDYQRIQQEKETLEAKNKQLYARLKNQDKSPKNLTNKTSDSPDIDSKLEKLELKTEGYTNDEIEFISQYGGKKALENPIVKTALEVMREKAKAEKAVVDSSEDAGSIEKKYTQEQLKKMSADELEELIRSSK